MTEAPRTLLGFDFGTKRIGVAIGQEATQSASPLETLLSIDERPDWDGISRLIDTWNPAALVVGIPYLMDGSTNEMTRAAERFANRLAGRYHLAVFRVDERLSSIEAESIIHATKSKDHPGKKFRMTMVDAVAAKVILETYFSQQAHARHDTAAKA